MELLARHHVRKDPIIEEMATKYKVSPTQVILAWHLGRKTLPIPKSTNPDRMRENLDVR
jgi:diketogulonate reductase-like aldo/keto reductase